MGFSVLKATESAGVEGFALLNSVHRDSQALRVTSTESSLLPIKRGLTILQFNQSNVHEALKGVDAHQDSIAG